MIKIATYAGLGMPTSDSSVNGVVNTNPKKAENNARDLGNQPVFIQQGPAKLGANLPISLTTPTTQSGETREPEQIKTASGLLAPIKGVNLSMLVAKYAKV